MADEVQTLDESLSEILSTLRADVIADAAALEPKLNDLYRRAVALRRLEAMWKPDEAPALPIDGPLFLALQAFTRARRHTQGTR